MTRLASDGNGWKADAPTSTIQTMNVALQFDEPWDFTEHLAGKWWDGSLGSDGWVILSEPFHFRGREHRRVHVQPRHGDDLSNLREGEQIVVNQLVHTPEGDLGLIGSLKRVPS